MAEPEDSGQVCEKLAVGGSDYAGLCEAAGPPRRDQTGTIIYVQPDGSLVEGSGLTEEEQRRLVEQLSKQQLVEVSEEEAARILGGVSEGTAVSLTREGVAGQAVAQAFPEETTGAAKTHMNPITFMQNAAQQLQSVAQHVALQNKVNAAVSRLIQQKQLESILIHVQPVQMKENKEKPMPPLAAIHPQTLKLNQPLNKILNTSGLSLHPQLIRIQPITDNGEQQFVLRKAPSNPPIQLLVQRARTPVGATCKVTTPTLNGKNKLLVPTISANGKNTPFVPTFSADVLSVTAKHLVTSLGKKEKLKKSLKVKTRSGRISRPPKHKAKDYKFIKVGDLADGHPSDSDDYSELSMEDEDEEEELEKDDLSMSDYKLKPKMFKCETCEKSYIGKGGLARHYKLFPEHGKVDYNGTDKSVYLTLSATAGLDDESVPPQHVEEIEIDSLSDQQSGQSVEGERLSEPLDQDEIKILWSPTMRRGPGRPKGCGRSDRPRLVGRPRSTGKRGRRGQLAKLHSVTTEQHVLRRKTRLKELLQQCENEDLKELALPLLTKLVTVFEFLLMKVEKGNLEKPNFQDIYREFENLHDIVKDLAQDHYRNVSILTIQEPLEIKNPKVAESLGITDAFFGKPNHILSTLQEDSVLKRVDKDIMEINPQLAHECPDQKLFPPAKKIRTESISENKPNPCTRQNGIEQTSWNWCVQSTHEGSILHQNEKVTPAKNSIIDDCSNGRTENADSTESHGQQCKDFSSLEARNDSTNSNLPLCPRNKILDSSQSTSWSITSENNLAKAHQQPVAAGSQTVSGNWESKESVRSHFEIQNAQCNVFLHSECSNAMPLMAETINQSIYLSNGEGGLHKDVEEQELHHSAINNDTFNMQEHSEQLNTADQLQQFNNISVNLPTDNLPLYKTQSEPSLTGTQETSLATKFQNLNESTCSINDQSFEQSELEGAVSAAGNVAFEFASNCQDLFTPGQEQIFIQTSDGLILSHLGGAGLSETEDLFVVTNADGTTMHIRTPGGVSLETVEALLAMEAEGASEGILISQCEIEL